MILRISRGKDITEIDDADSKIRELIDIGIDIIDLRTEAEFERGHIRGAVNINIYDSMHKFSDLPKDKKYLIYCHSGSRSTHTQEMMIRMGFKEVYNIIGYPMMRLKEYLE